MDDEFDIDDASPNKGRRHRRPSNRSRSRSRSPRRDSRGRSPHDRGRSPRNRSRDRSNGGRSRSQSPNQSKSSKHHHGGRSRGGGGRDGTSPEMNMRPGAIPPKSRRLQKKKLGADPGPKKILKKKKELGGIKNKKEWDSEIESNSEIELDVEEHEHGHGHGRVFGVLGGAIVKTRGVVGDEPNAKYIGQGKRMSLGREVKGEGWREDSMFTGMAGAGVAGSTAATTNQRNNNTSRGGKPSEATAAAVGAGNGISGELVPEDDNEPDPTNVTSEELAKVMKKIACERDQTYNPDVKVWFLDLRPGLGDFSHEQEQKQMEIGGGGAAAASSAAPTIAFNNQNIDGYVHPADLKSKDKTTSVGQPIMRLTQLFDSHDDEETRLKQRWGHTHEDAIDIFHHFEYDALMRRKKIAGILKSVKRNGYVGRYNHEANDDDEDGGNVLKEKSRLLFYQKEKCSRFRNKGINQGVIDGEKGGGKDKLILPKLPKKKTMEKFLKNRPSRQILVEKVRKRLRKLRSKFTKEQADGDAEERANPDEKDDSLEKSPNKSLNKNSSLIEQISQKLATQKPFVKTPYANPHQWLTYHPDQGFIISEKSLFLLPNLPIERQNTLPKEEEILSTLPVSLLNENIRKNLTPRLPDLCCLVVAEPMIYRLDKTLRCRVMDEIREFENEWLMRLNRWHENIGEMKNGLLRDGYKTEGADARALNPVNKVKVPDDGEIFKYVSFQKRAFLALMGCGVADGLFLDFSPCTNDSPGFMQLVYVKKGICKLGFDCIDPAYCRGLDYCIGYKNPESDDNPESASGAARARLSSAPVDGFSSVPRLSIDGPQSRLSAPPHPSSVQQSSRGAEGTPDAGEKDRVEEDRVFPIYSSIYRKPMTMRHMKKEAEQNDLLKDVYKILLERRERWERRKEREREQTGGMAEDEQYDEEEDKLYEQEETVYLRGLVFLALYSEIQKFADRTFKDRCFPLLPLVAESKEGRDMVKMGWEIEQILAVRKVKDTVSPGGGHPEAGGVGGGFVGDADADKSLDDEKNDPMPMEIDPEQSVEDSQKSVNKSHLTNRYTNEFFPIHPHEKHMLPKRLRRKKHALIYDPDAVRRGTAIVAHTHLPDLTAAKENFRFYESVDRLLYGSPNLPDKYAIRQRQPVGRVGARAVDFVDICSKRGHDTKGWEKTLEAEGSLVPFDYKVDVMGGRMKAAEEGAGKDGKDGKDVKLTSEELHGVIGATAIGGKAGSRVFAAHAKATAKLTKGKGKAAQATASTTVAKKLPPPPPPPRPEISQIWKQLMEGRTGRHPIHNNEFWIARGEYAAWEEEVLYRCP